MSDLLRQQYQRSERARQRNKLAERKMVHDIESRNGLRALHEYRVEMVTREQKKVAKELERIRAGLRFHKHRLVAGHGRDRGRGLLPSVPAGRQGKSPPLKSSRSTQQYPTAKSGHASPRIATKSGAFSDRQLTGSLTDRRPAKQTQQGFMSHRNLDHSFSGRNKKPHSDDDDSDDDDDDYDDSDSDSEADPNNVPHPDLLKAIMQGVVNCWEETIVATAEMTYLNAKGIAPSSTSQKEVTDSVSHNTEGKDSQTFTTRDKGRGLVTDKFSDTKTTQGAKFDNSHSKIGGERIDTNSMHSIAMDRQTSSKSVWHKRRDSISSTHSQRVNLPPLDNRNAADHTARSESNKPAGSIEGQDFYGCKVNKEPSDRTPRLNSNHNRSILTGTREGGHVPKRSRSTKVQDLETSRTNTSATPTPRPSRPLQGQISSSQEESPIPGAFRSSREQIDSGELKGLNSPSCPSQSSDYEGETKRIPHRYPKRDRLDNRLPQHKRIVPDVEPKRHRSSTQSTSRKPSMSSRSLLPVPTGDQGPRRRHSSQSKNASSPLSISSTPHLPPLTDNNSINNNNNNNNNNSNRIKRSDPQEVWQVDSSDFPNKNCDSKERMRGGNQANVESNVGRRKPHQNPTSDPTVPGSASSKPADAVFPKSAKLHIYQGTSAHKN